MSHGTSFIYKKKNMLHVVFLHIVCTEELNTHEYIVFRKVY